MYLLGEWGFVYDEAQKFVIRESLREQPDGRWAAKEVGDEEPRQNGKGEKLEGRECLGLFYFEERKLIHSAHEFATASEALDRMDDRIGQNPKLKAKVKSVKRSHGEEGVYLKDGRKLLYKTRTKGGGRGFSADLLILDEAMYIAETFLGALMPVISARPNPQIWYTGSAVDQKEMPNGVVFGRLRQRALDRKPGRVAYFGWSASYVDNKVIWETPADVPVEATADPDVIARANSALGIRIGLDHVLETEREAMSHEQFCVERLGVGDWPKVGENAATVIDMDAWADLEDPESEISSSVCFAYDVKPDRSMASICAAGLRSDGLFHVEVVDHRRGAGWVAKRLAELTGRHDSLGIGCAGDDAKALIPSIKALDMKVDVQLSPEHAQACAQLVDGVNDAEFRHLGTPELEAALRGAAKSEREGGWTWSRKNSSVDICPLVAATLALGLAKQRCSIGEPLVAWS